MSPPKLSRRNRIENATRSTTIETPRPLRTRVLKTLKKQNQTKAVMAQIRNKAKEILRGPWDVTPYRNLRIVIDQSELTEIAHLPDMVNIEPWIRPQTRGERQGQILANQLNAFDAIGFPITRLPRGACGKLTPPGMKLLFTAFNRSTPTVRRWVNQSS